MRRFYELVPRSEDGPPPMTGTWRTQDTIYVALVGTVLLAAVVEWILWLLAFLYCLLKVYQKAEGKGRRGIKILALLNVCMH